jgi:hypothetical protein
MGQWSLEDSADHVSVSTARLLIGVVLETRALSHLPVGLLIRCATEFFNSGFVDVLMKERD